MSACKIGAQLGCTINYYLHYLHVINTTEPLYHNLIYYYVIEQRGDVTNIIGRFATTTALFNGVEDLCKI